MWPLVCLLGILATSSGNTRRYYNEMEFSPLVPEFPGIDPELVKAAFSNSPVSSSVTPSASFSPAGPSSYSSSVNPLPPSSEYSSSSPSFTSSSAPPSYLLYEVLYSQSAPVSSATSSQSVYTPYTQTSQDISPVSPYPNSNSPPATQSFPTAFAPPPPPSYNIIDIPESAVIPISTFGYLSPYPASPASSSSQYKAPYAPHSPHSVYGPPGYSPPPVLASSIEREDERFLKDSLSRLNDGVVVLNRSPATGKYKFRDYTPYGTARRNMVSGKIPVRISYPFVQPRGLKVM